MVHTTNLGLLYAATASWHCMPVLPVTVVSGGASCLPFLKKDGRLLRSLGPVFSCLMTFYHHQAHCACSMQALPCSDSPRELLHFINESQMHPQFWAGERFHWVKAFAATFVSPWDSHGGKGEPVPSGCPLASEFMLWYVCLPPYTHTNK